MLALVLKSTGIPDEVGVDDPAEFGVFPDSISDPFLWARIVEKERRLGRFTSEGCLKGLGSLRPAEEETLRAGAAEPP